MTQVVGYRPADDLAREQVEHDGQVEPALRRPDVGDVGEPDPIEGGCLEGAAEQVWRDGKRVGTLLLVRRKRRWRRAASPMSRIRRAMRLRPMRRP